MKLIPLTQGKFAMVDDEDYLWLNQWRWGYDRGYATRRISIGKGKQIRIHMHRLVNNTPNNTDTDHKDLNPLNNQQHNLRNCTNAQNQWNRKIQKNGSSQYRGVGFIKRKSPWQASIRFYGKLIHIGTFALEKDAAIAYDRKAVELFGEFARINFP